MNFSFIPDWIEAQFLKWKAPEIPKQLILSDAECRHFRDQLADITSPPTLVIGNQEKTILRKIKDETAQLNRNNLTRTQAYLNFYVENPEVDWSFLAHMVSRNGGYYMTDLKSDDLPALLSEKDKEAYFLFLERSNASIFLDAYPQLRLYEESKRAGRPLFHLLPSFHVSKFMIPFWYSFFQTKHKALITIALIINEQQMLEKRVLKNSQSKDVLSDLPFQIQEALGFTNIFFPYRSSRKLSHRLSGLTVQQFSIVEERIETGKKLYQILFAKPFHAYTLAFATQHPHTGSRSDYWPNIYTSSRVSAHQKQTHSPALLDVWPDRVHPSPNYADWFSSQHLNVVNVLANLPAMKDYDQTLHALKNLLLFHSLASMQK